MVFPKEEGGYSKIKKINEEKKISILKRNSKSLFPSIFNWGTKG
jgi:hypothetical protein